MGVRLHRSAIALTTAASAVLGAPTPAPAQPVQQMVYADPATDNCPVLIDAVEKRRNIPHGLLMAIALTESGYGGRPSPVAMNIAGRAYHANGSQDMAWVIQQNAARGVTSIDVGCMQVNLKYHGSDFANPLQLLDSATNVEYAASFLIRLATESGSWRDAVMSYHNKTNPGRRAWYGCKVWNNYLRVSGASIGYLSCGGTPHGSSTAAIGPAQGPAPSPIQMTSYQPSASPAAAGDPDVRTVRVGSVDVDVPNARRAAAGRADIMTPGQSIASVVENDSRAAAFTSIHPGSAERAASSAGFAQVSYQN